MYDPFCSNGIKWIKHNSIKQKMLCIYYFLTKRNKLFGQPNRYHARYWHSVRERS